MITHADVLKILTKHDPVGIIYENNNDEYEPEAKSIAARIDASHGEKEILKIVHDEFAKWFGDKTIGSKEKYNSIASDIVKLIQ